MKTSFGRLTLLTVSAAAALYLFLPFNSAKLSDTITVEPQAVMLERGETVDLDYTLHSRYPQTVRFLSADSNIAQVDQRGMITAVSPGRTRVTIKAQNGARTNVPVTVTGSAATSLRLSAQNITLNKGQVTGLKALFNKDADENTALYWSCENENIARVDASGRVYGISGGSTVVHVRTDNGLDAQVSVFVQVPATAMQIDPDDITVGLKSVMRLGCSFFPADATDSVILWRSEDPSIISVDPGGRITANAEGSTMITAESRGGLTDSIIVTVDRKADSFEIVPHAVTIERGSSVTLNTVFTDRKGDIDTDIAGHYIRWNTSNSFIASVDEGKITGLQSGVVQVTATVDGITSVCDVTVQTSVKSVALNMDEVTLTRDQTGQPIRLEAALTPEDADEPNLVYTTDNPQVALVSETGLVTLSGAYGTAVITATASSGAQASFTVNVVADPPAETEE